MTHKEAVRTIEKNAVCHKSAEGLFAIFNHEEGRIIAVGTTGEQAWFLARLALMDRSTQALLEDIQKGN